MDRLRYIFVFVGLLLSHTTVIAQGSGVAEERVFLHVNTTTFVTGETLYFKVYALNPADNTSSFISKIAYVELIDVTKKNVFKSKIYLTDGNGEGDFFIPTTIPSGNYKLIAYTKWMLNASLSNFFQTDLMIINPFQSAQKSIATETSNSETQLSLVSKEENTKVFSMATDKKTYSNREKVSLKINTPNQKIEKGNYSLSVRKLENLPYKAPLSAAEIPGTNSGNANLSRQLPEIRGELVTGYIASKNPAKQLNDKTIALSIPGKSFAFKVVKTNTEGKFIFILDKEPNSSNCYIQVMEEDRKDYILQLDEPVKPDLSSLKIAASLVLDPVLKNTIESHSIANQIENAYYDKKKDSLTTEKKDASFFHTLEKQYLLDDYSRFPTMAEVITEIVTELYYRKNGDAYSIHLRDLNTNAESYGNALVLVDGLLVQDVNELFDYNMGFVHRVDLINQGYVYGPKIFSGVVNFVTKNSDYLTKASGDFIKKTTLERPATNKKYSSPEYSGVKASERIPDYRYQLLWNPELTLENPENFISFYTSDISGTFEIVLEGFSEKGNAVTITTQIEVK